MKRLVVALASVPVICLLAAPANSAELRIKIATEPSDLDPAIRTDTGSGYLIQNIYDPLIEIGTDNRVSTKYAVADSWEWRDDLHGITIKLKEGIKFHDGSELTAADVKYNFDWQLDPDKMPPSSVSSDRSSR